GVWWWVWLRSLGGVGVFETSEVGGPGGGAGGGIEVVEVLQEELDGGTAGPGAEFSRIAQEGGEVVAKEFTGPCVHDAMQSRPDDVGGGLRFADEGVPHGGLALGDFSAAVSRSVAGGACDDALDGTVVVDVAGADEMYGQDIGVAVVLKEGSKEMMGRRQLQKWVRGKVAGVEGAEEGESDGSSDGRFGNEA
ncbi:MAG: hypothetical protein LQ341_007487, partial [Variospora aurantia]